MREGTLQNIKKANAKEVDEILDAAMERRRQLFPDWKMVYYASPKKILQEGKDEFVELTGQMETK